METLEHLYITIESHLIHDTFPSKFLNNIIDDPIFKVYPFDMLSRLQTVEQSQKHHPEGNVWNHTMLVVDEAAKVINRSKDAKVFMWAALLHDIGKYSTTKIRKGKITSYEHDNVGADMADKFLNKFTKDKEFIFKVVALVRWHMQILFVVNNLPFANIKDMKSQVDIKEIALLGECDRLGRLNVDKEKENENIKLFIQKCSL